MGNAILSVVKKETFFLDNSNHRDLVGSQWAVGYKTWFAYRSITLLYLVILLIVGFTNKFMRYGWIFFTMLTHWAFLIFVLCYLLKWICVIKHKRWFKHDQIKDIPEEEKPLLFRQQSWITNYQQKKHYLLAATWLVSNIAHVFAIQVTIGYWKDGAVVSFANLPDALNFQMHGVNAAMAILDILLIAQPTFLCHLYQPILFLCCYYSFTAFYYAAGGLSKAGTRYIYPNINWKYPDKAMIYFAETVLNLFLIHTGICLVALIRTIIGNSMSKKHPP